MTYGYQMVKVARHYGERDDLQAFLDQCGRNGWVIEQALELTNGYFTFIYSIPAQNTGNPR